MDRADGFEAPFPTFPRGIPKAELRNGMWEWQDIYTGKQHSAAKLAAVQLAESLHQEGAATAGGIEETQLLTGA